MKPIKAKRATQTALACLIFSLFAGVPAAFSQQEMANGVTLFPGFGDERFIDYRIPNNPAMPYLFLSVTGADGGKRSYASLTSCTKEGGQGASASAWFKIGEGGLLPGGILRVIMGRKGEDAHGIGIEGAGGGGGTAFVYLPPNVYQNDPTNGVILLVAGGGGGAAASGVCAGSSGLPGQETANGGNGNGAGPGEGGTDGEGATLAFGHNGNAGGGGGWKTHGSGLCEAQDNYNKKEYSIYLSKYDIRIGAGFAGSGKATAENGDLLWNFWEGGDGGPSGSFHIPCYGNFHAGGYGFGGGGSGHGSGGGGGYSGGGSGGLVGISGGGGGGGGGSYVNPDFALPFVSNIQKRGTTSDPKDGSMQYQFFATSPVAYRDLGFHYNKNTEASILKTGEWTLRWQSDGNLVLYQSGAAKWASNTNTKGTDIYFQSDGNLVIRQSGNAIWASATANDQHGGKGGRKLVLTQEGSLFIADQDGKVIWKGH